MSRKSALAALVVLALAAFWFSQRNDQTVVEAGPLSPWDSLTSGEIAAAAEAVRARHGQEVRFNRISLRQPEKAVALSWQADQQAVRGAEIVFRTDGAFKIANYDFSTADLEASHPLKDGQPMLSSDGELLPTVMQLNESETILAALAKRGVEAGDGLCLPRTTGRFFSDLVDAANDRMVRLDCFNIKGQGRLGILPSTNAFARPIEGLSVLYDIGKQQIIEVTDSYEGKDFPPHDIVAEEFHDGAMETRPTLKPVITTRPEGQNFTIRGGHIDWQNWSFYLRFDPRQGTILNRVGHQSAAGFRSVAYEIAMSEMFVPYHDPDTHWFYRAYFDMGEYGLGALSTELKGSDCPSHARYQNVTLHDYLGEPMQAENRICIFEHDPGHPMWRHHEPLYDGVPGMDNHQSRSATELVVRMVATIGNYDYFQDYVFQQDGRLRIRLVSTGIDATKGVFSRSLDDATAAAETATGTLIAPYRLGVNHDHFFNYRIDMDIDGTANNFDRLKLQAIAQPEGAPRQGIWGVVPQAVETEAQAQTRMNSSKPAVLLFSSGEAKNQMGYPTGYQIMMPNVKPLVSLEDPIYQRAAFVRNNLWVTRFKRDEIFSSGLGVNQSAPKIGLPDYIADNQNIRNKDIVAWATMGFHHVPMAEDWPVMPAKVDQIILKPRNYFDRNPSIDLAN